MSSKSPASQAMLRMVVAIAGGMLNVCAASQAWATDGYLALGYGTQSKGMGGAGLADPKDALAIANNPAAAFALGDRNDIDLDLMFADRHASLVGNANGPDQTFSGNGGGPTPIPEFGLTRREGDNWALGLAVYTGGVATAYETNPFARFGATGTAGVQLAQAIISPTAAYEIAPGQSIGVALDVGVQMFKARGIQPFAANSADPSHFSNLGTDYIGGLGYKFGYLGQVTDRFSLGAFYQSRTYSQKFDKYAGLFVNQGAFDIPATYGVGVSFKATENLDIDADVHRIEYGDIPSLGNTLNPLLTGQQFGAPNGPGFGWRDINAFKIGANYRLSPEWQVRAGWDHSDNPIPSSQTLLSILAPAVVQDQFTVGATWTRPSGFEISGYVMEAPKVTVSGSGSIPGAFGGGESNIALGETVIGIGFGWKN